MLHRITAIALFVLIVSTLVAQEKADSPKTSLEVKASGMKAFYVDDVAGSNQVSFTSAAPLEDITGVCNKVAGECRLDPRHVETFSGKFSIRVADMRTGIELRDEHLRSADWLDAAASPEIIIEVKKVEDVKKTGASTATLKLVGQCTIRGKTRDIEIPATLAYLDETPETQKKVKGDLVRVRAEFKVKLSDYGVSGPKGSEMIGLKVADEIEIRAAVYGSTEKPPAALKADRPAATQSAKPAPPRRP